MILSESGEQNTFGSCICFSSPLQQTIFYPITVAVCEKSANQIVSNFIK